MGGLQFVGKGKKELSKEQLKNEEQLEKKIIGDILPYTEKKQEEEKEKEIVTTVRIPESLMKEFDEYIENEAKRKESKNYCLVEGLRLYLKVNKEK